MNAKTKNRAAKLFERIIELSNKHGYVKFSEDFSIQPAALTITIGSRHWHSFPTVSTTEELINWLYENMKDFDEQDD